MADSSSFEADVITSTDNTGSMAISVVQSNVVESSTVIANVITGGKGQDGTNGVDGVDGTDGTNGTNGTNGAPGVVQSINGYSAATVTLTQDDVADGTTYKRYSATEKTKLAGIATAATANDTDANLKNRANHTGTQTASTISDFSTAADARITSAIGTTVQAYDSDLTAFAAKTAPSGAVLGTTDTQTLTNKDLTSGTNTFPTFNQNTTGTAAKWTTARNLAGNSVDGSAAVAFANKFIVQGTTDTGLSAAQFLGALGTGLVKNTTTTGVLSIAASGTDYAPATSGSSILKGNGSGGFSTATAGTDYYNPGGTDVAVTDGGTGRSTSTTAYGLIAAGTTATGAHQTLAAGATTDILVGGGASALPAWTTATGSGSPVRATSPTLVTPALGTPSALTLTNATGLVASTGTTATGTPSSATFLRGDNTWSAPAGSGDVTGPSSSVDSEIALFSSTTGKVIKRASATGMAKLTSGVLSTVTAPSGTIVGDTDTQTLTNKTFDATSPSVFNYPGDLKATAVRLPPTGWLNADGSAVSRATYAALFAAIVPSLGTFTVTIASPAVVTRSAHGLSTGDQIYLTTTSALPTGLSANTLYYAIRIDATTFNLASSQANAIAATKINTTGSQSGTHTVWDCPWGLGNGSTTFTLPDIRGRNFAGMDTTGGTAAGRLTLARPQGSYGNLGSTGGSESHTLLSSESGVPAHTHDYAGISGAGQAEFGPSGLVSPTNNATATRANTAANAASGHNNVGPTAVVNVIIKT